MNQHRRRGGIALGAAGAALAGSMMLATPASAHTPTWEVTCDSVTVDLTRYSADHKDTVTVSAGDEQLVSQEFGTAFHETLKLPPHSAPLEVTLTVDAGDHDKFDVRETKTAPVCEGEEPESPSPTPSVPSEEPTPSEKPTPTESAVPTPSPSQTSSTPPVKPAADESPAPTTDLAETGSSGSTPMIAGIAATVLAAGAGLMMVRKRRSAKG